MKCLFSTGYDIGRKYQPIWVSVLVLDWKQNSVFRRMYTIPPNCLPKSKSLGFQWKKASLDVRSPCLLRLTAGLKQTFVTKHCRFVPIDTLAWDKFDLFKQFLWNQSNESSDSRNQIRQHFCTLLFAVCYIFFRKKQHGEQIFTCHYHFL